MAKTRSNEPVKEPNRKTVKKSCKVKKKISIPMILTCDGDMTSLLPWFENFSEMLCKRIRKDVQKASRARRKKAATKKKALKKPSPTEESLPPNNNETEPMEAPWRRGCGRVRKAANPKMWKPPVPIRRRKRGPRKSKPPNFVPRQKRKSLLHPGPTISASETGPSPESSTIVAAPFPCPIATAENRETFGLDEGQHRAGTYATRRIPYNFQDAWNEAVNSLNYDADMLTSVTMTRLRLTAAPPERNPPLDPSTTEECSIYKYIRKSLGEICPSTSIHSVSCPSTSNSTQSELDPANVVDIYSHVQNSLAEESLRANGSTM